MRRLLGLAAATGMLLTAGLAQAQTVHVDVPPSLDSGGNPVQGASGTYHSVIQNVGGGFWTIHVSGHDDGNKPDDDPLTLPNKSGIGRISVNFFDTEGTQMLATPSAGSGFAGAYSGPVGGNVGGPFNVPFGNTGGPWSNGSPGTLIFSTDSEDAFVAPFGGNAFSGVFSLSGGNGVLGSYTISLQDSGQQWTATVDVTRIPEPGSLAMLLPGLAPMGFMLRRRRAAKA